MCQTKQQKGKTIAAKRRHTGSIFKARTVSCAAVARRNQPSRGYIAPLSHSKPDPRRVCPVVHPPDFLSVHLCRGSNPVLWTHRSNVDTDQGPVPVRVMCALGRSLYNHSALGATCAWHMPRRLGPPALAPHALGSVDALRALATLRALAGVLGMPPSKSGHPLATLRRAHSAAVSPRLQGCLPIVPAISLLH